MCAAMMFGKFLEASVGTDKSWRTNSTMLQPPFVVIGKANLLGHTIKIRYNAMNLSVIATKLSMLSRNADIKKHFKRVMTKTNLCGSPAHAWSYT